jgi:transcription antitermination factor NusG
MAWIIVVVKPNQSKKAEENLAFQGHKTFFPRIYYQNNGNRYVKDLFSGYAFVMVNNLEKLSAINSTKGISRVLRVNNQIPQLPDDTIINIQNQLDVISLESNLTPIFKKDDQVIIRLKLLSGQRARVIDIIDKRSAQKILLAILNSAQTIWVNQKDISPIKPMISLLDS